MNNWIVYLGYNPSKECLDGLMAATITYMGMLTRRRDSINIYPEYIDDVNKLDRFRPFVPGDSVVIVGFSYPISVMRKWQQQGIRISVITHRYLDNLHNLGSSSVIANPNESASTLAWKYWFPDQEMPELLVHIKRRATDPSYYNGVYPTSKAINGGLNKMMDEAMKYPICGLGYPMNLIMVLIGLLKTDWICSMLYSHGIQ